MLKFKKKFRRFTDTLFLYPIDRAPALRGHTKKDILSFGKLVKPKQRLAYYKDFRKFIKEVKFEFIYENN